MNGLYLGAAVVAGFVLCLPLVLLTARRTARRVQRLLERARAAERLAELGTLTSGLAHEIKNPLSSVNLNIQLIQEDIRQLAGQEASSENDQELLGRVGRRFDSLTRETQRLRDILEDFLRFAGRLELDPSPTNLNALVDELADFFNPQAAAAGVQIRTQLGAQPATASVDGAHLKQAILNLMLNAVHAMEVARQKNQPHGGARDLIIRTERLRQEGQDEIQVHVTDTGPGIAAENLGRIFEPYFTTRRGGTGLGLPTARRIVDAHGGALRVHSEVGRGSDFCIALPMDKH
ncbi:MAG: hypothetical protein IT441_11000 [Phycisphaeraceae bacterium]|nr:hypothetical protein [Phycisphaeraceae bacterium]